MTTKQSYSLTISPMDRTHAHALAKRVNPLRCVYDEDVSVIKHALSLAKIRHYIIFPELDIKGRLHYHGTLYMNKTHLIRFYKQTKGYFQRIGFVDIQPTKKPIEWLIYTRKQWPYTSNILDITRPIVNMKIFGGPEYKNKNNHSLDPM